MKRYEAKLEAESESEDMHMQINRRIQNNSDEEMSEEEIKKQLE